MSLPSERMSVDLDAVIAAASFDENDVDMATAGLCGTFALAMKYVFPDVVIGLVCLSGADGEPLRADDGDPMWRHVVVMADGLHFDVDGRVLPEHVIENYCWGNPAATGGCVVPIGPLELSEILCNDNKSFDGAYLKRWATMLQDGLDRLSAASPSVSRSSIMGT